MFNNLRAGSPVYIFYKSNPSYAIGEVIRIENQIDQYGNKVYENLMLQQKAAYVDIVARVNGGEQRFNHIGAEYSITDSGPDGVVLSDNLREFTDAIGAFSKIKEKNVAHHDKDVADIEACRSIMCELDPQKKKESEQAREIEELKQGMAELKAMLSQVIGHGSK